MRHDFPIPRFEGLLHRLYRAMVFRRKLAAMGKGAFVSPFATLEGMEGISIAAGATISRRCHVAIVSSPENHGPSVISIGARSYIGRGCTLSACGAIEIGADVTFGDNVYLSAGQHGFSEPGRRILDQPMRCGRVEVGNGAWIGYGAFISTTAKLVIGEGAIVAANAVVTRDVPPFTMVGGIPARAIQHFDFESGEWRKLQVKNGE